jgi:hypothetical protein
VAALSFSTSPQSGRSHFSTCECLDRMLTVRRVETELHGFVDHCNGHRPHRLLGQPPPQPKGVMLTGLKYVDRSSVGRTDQAAGLIHRYCLVARRG